MSAKATIKAASELGIKLYFEDEQLKTLGPKGAMTDALRQQIISNKTELIDYLSSADLAVVAPKESESKKAEVWFKPSYSQQRLWFIDQLEGGTSQYNITAQFKLTGELNQQAFKKAIAKIVERHAALRTRFVQKKGVVYQVVGRMLPLAFDTIELKGLVESQQTREVQRLAALEMVEPFDLQQGPLVRGKILALSDAEYVVLITMHHIASDGWSMGLFFNELNVLYNSFVEGRESPLAPLPLQYTDYAYWQRDWLQGEVLSQQLGYWEKQLSEAPSTHNLPLDKPRGRQQTFSGLTHSQYFERQITTQIKELCQQQNVTLFILLQTALAVLVSRYSNEADIVIGTPIAGRSHKDTEALIGYFINTLALRTRLDKQQGFCEVLANNKQVVLDAFTFQQLPFEMLVEQLKPERSPSHSPIFQIFFALQNNERATFNFTNIEFTPISTPATVVRFDLELNVAEHEGQLILGWNYNTDLFELSTIERLSDSYRLLLEGILLDADRAVGELPLLSADQQQQLRLWNATDQMLPGEQGIHELFELQASNSPDAIAVVMEDHCISYGELNRRANQLAGYLLSQGVSSEERIGVCMDRSVELIIALLGILKSGGVYVPLDMEYPTERLAYMVQDAGVDLVLTHSDVEVARQIGARALSVDSLDKQLSGYSVDNPGVSLSKDNLAYVIYTSGSTGQPKGVVVTHQGITRLLFGVDYMSLDSSVRILQASSVSFDASTLEIWGGLLHGGCCILLPGKIPEAEHLRHSISEQKVNSAWLTSALFNALIDDSPDSLVGLRQLAVGGEAVSPQHVSRLYGLDDQVRIINGYGPTESTTFACCYEIPRSDEVHRSVPIGYPIGNTQCYVVGADLHQVPVGVVGELYLGGLGLARGYLDRGMLTAERFVPNPYGQPGSRMYRTGDLVRYRADGDLEYVGRIDHQVKLRGFRIELGEIESALEHHAGVDSGLVQVVDSDLGQQLVGYITTEQSLEEAKLKQSLQQVLPSYMVPMAIVQLESFPLTANGKVDRERLPSPDWEAYRQSYVGARDEVEHQLVSIFESLLPVDRVGIDDNFFELGGHSLLATQLISKVRQQLDVELPLRVLFEQPTVAGLSAQLGLHRDGVVLSAIERVDRDADLALSYAQQRLWFIDQLEGGSSQYNMPVAYRLKGELNTAAFMAALDTIVERHEVLRTHFEVREDQTYQVIAEGVGADVEQLDLSDLDDSDQLHQVQQLAALQAQQDFDLSSDVMLRVQLIKLSEVDHVVLSTMHHVASDGWSMGIFFRELSHLYRAYSDDQEPVLPELPVQYADYARWQRDWLSGEVLSKQLGYWEQQLSGVAPVHNLPLDHSRPNTQSFVGQVHRVLVDADLSQRLRDYCQSHEVTMFMFLETVFALLVSRYSGEDDIVIGTPIAGRDHGDTEGLIGFFVNTLVLRTGIQAGQGFGDLLKANKQTILDAYTHQHIPFEMLVEELKPERSLSHGPIFQLSFTLHKEGQGVLELAGLELGAVESSHRIIKFDLELNVAEHEGQLILGWNYNTDLFELSTIERLSDSYRLLLEGILLDADRAVGELPLLSADQQQQLRLWNATDQMLPGEQGIHELFELQASNSPDAIAVVMEDHCISYGELNRRANQLAGYLLSQGVSSEERIGVCMDRSVELIIALLGILKSGGVYVPLDMEYPTERLAYMVQDAGVDLVLTHSDVEVARQIGARALSVDSLDKQLSGYSVDNPGVSLSKDNLAYVIYTSGSTGQPKGVVVTHQGITRLLFGVDYMSLDSSVRILQASSVSFDASTLEIWGGLLHGGCCILLPGKIPEAEHLRHSISEQKVNSAWLTSALFNALIDDSPDSLVGLRQLAVGGEAVSPQHVSRLYGLDDQVRIINGYGPTESTTFACCYEIPRSDEVHRSVPIGYPIGNTQCYVVDADLHQVPVGVVGELYLGGLGLARGYLDRGMLTAERFVPNPYGQPGSRMYRTGDLVRYRADGDLEYVGRIDHQVKLRGFRIELGEIESALEHHAGVDSGLVQVVDSDLGQQLVGYITTEQPLEEAKLKQSLQQVLPSYMVPMAIVQLESFPLTANGKVDRERLPSPDWEAYRQSYVGARDEVEHQLVSIFESLLPVDRVGIDDNFFELGGHSLLAAQVISRVRRELDIEIPLKLLFENPSIRLLVSGMQQYQQSTVIPAITRKELGVDAPVSYAQQRLWFIDQLEGGSRQYNVPLHFMLRGALNVDAFQRAIKEVIERHHVLRTNFIEREGELLQVVQKAPTTVTELIDLSTLNEDEKVHRVEALAVKNTSQDFDLRSDLMLRAQLVRISTEEHIVLFTVHHIAFDGWSIKILLNEVINLYQSFDQQSSTMLSPLNIQYGDYAQWQREWLQGEVLAKQLAYWESQLADIPQVHNFPLDKPRPKEQSFTGQLYTQHIGKKRLDQITELSQSSGTTLFMVLQTAFALLLNRYSNEADILIGTPTAGRTHQDLEPLIGNFVNTLVLRNKIPVASSFTELLELNRTMILQAFDNQYIPFEMLVDQLQVERDLSCNPLCQVKFVLQNFDRQFVELPELTLSVIPSKITVARFDLDLTAVVADDVLHLNWTYKSDLFESTTIEQLADNFARLLESIIDEPDLAVEQLPIISSANQQLLLGYGQGQKDISMRDLRISDAIARQAQLTPQRIAIKGVDASITYEVLNNKANRLASYLIEEDIGFGVNVGIYVERSIDLLVGLLGILKSGATYVPMEPSNTSERLGYIVQHAGIDTVLVTSDLLERISLSQVDILLLDDCATDPEWLAGYTESEPDVNAPDMSEHVAYIIYTSGSTGVPKGVRISHQSLADYCAYALNHYYQDNLKASLVVTSHGFDITVPSLYLPLLKGDYVELLPWGNELDSLAQALQQPAAPNYLLRLTPVHVAGLLSILHQDTQLLSAHVFVIGGAQLTYEIVRRLAEQFPNAKLYNHYGPSEATVGCTINELSSSMADGAGPVPIGKPMSNTFLYVLDRHRQLLPRGAIGELYVGGAGLSLGYINDSELNEASFITSKLADGLDRRVYKTGDLVRWLPDGKLEFSGRIDDQVKIRGFRIELGEIESHLTRQEAIEVAAVIAIQSDDSEQQLAAYVVPAGLITDHVDELGEEARNAIVSDYKNKLSDSLPKYMVPALFVLLDKMPLTSSGKIDRKALPLPGASALTRAHYVEPANDNEMRMCQIWEQLLRVDQIGVTDNFFELGGHSLLATRLVSQIRQVFELEMPLRALFEQPTVRGLTASFAKYQQQLVLPPITQSNNQDEWLVSYAQQRLWFIDQLDQGSAQYNMPIHFKLNGMLDVSALEQAIATIVHRHTVLRTNFFEKEAEIYQVIQSQPTISLKVIELDSKLSESAQIKQLVQADIQQSFDLKKALLFRAGLIKVADDQHIVLLNVHHIASDGWSIGILLSELSVLYNAYSQGQPDPLPPLAIQYRDYAQWQRNWLRGQVLDAELEYWQQQLAGIPQVHSLPLDKPRPLQQAFNGQVYFQGLDDKLTEQIQQLCNDQSITLFMLMHTAFAVLISRYSNETDIVMGTPVAGRNHADTEALIGFFINSLVLRTRLDSNPSFQQALDANKQTILDAFTHQHIPFETLVETIQPERDLRFSPIFQILFTVQNNEQAELELNGLDMEPLDQAHNIIKFDLELGVREVNNHLVVTWNYDTELFNEATIKRLADNFATLLSSIVADPEQKVQALPMLAAAEREQLLVTWNDTHAGYSKEQCVHHLFAAKAEQTPEAIAVYCEGQQLNYRQLNQQANRLAHYLIEQNIKPNVMVGIVVKRSIEMIIGVLAILKAGGVYVPLDPEAPDERLQYMADECELEIILTSGILDEKCQLTGKRTLPLDNLAEFSAYPDSNPDPEQVGVTAKDMAYVIYTSGSTGLPKGVPICHGDFVFHCQNVNDVFGITSVDRSIQFASLSVDTAQEQIFVALIAGAVSYIRGDTIWSADEFFAYLSDNHITVTCLPPSYIKLLLDADQNNDKFVGLADLRLIISGSEAFPFRLLEHWKRNNLFDRCQLMNAYGPSETTVTATVHQISEDDLKSTSVAIGKALTSRRIYVLDDELQPVPIGVSGELYIGGEGVTSGYINRPEISRERFINNPFVEGDHLYRTGDLVRWTVDGNLVFVSRRDNQVKVRGFRVEPGEVESHLSKCAGVVQAAVVARQVDQNDTAGMQLIAYVVPDTCINDKDGDQLAIRNTLMAKYRDELKRQLPDYMVPSIYVLLEAMPLLRNGKIDYGSLPEPDSQAVIKKHYVAPRNAEEQTLADIYQDLLSIDRVGIDDNFFELGGHSLLATQLISKVRQQLDVELPLRVLFEQPTVAGLSAQLGLHRDGVVLSAIERVDRDADLALSYAQQRLWFIDQLEGGSSQYNMPVAYRLKGELNTAAFMAALDTIVERHEVLRTHFEVREDQTYQVIAEGVGADVEQLDLSDLDDSDQLHQVQQLAALQAQQDFDLSSDVMLRVQLIKLSEVDHVVLSTMHHVASDGWSMGIFFRELSHLYRAYSDDQEPVLPELPVQYADYARWQRDWLSGEVLSKQLGYWEQQLSGVAPVHNLPLDHSRPNTQSFVGQVHRVLVDADLSQRLRDYCQSHEVTMFMFLETVFALLVSRYSGEDDIVIGTPIAGRDHGDTEGLIGFFVNTLVLRTGIQAGQGFGDLLKANKQTILDAYTHQHIPFEMLVEELKPERSLSHGPIFQLSFTLHKEGQGVLELAGLELGAVESSHRIIKFDLELNVAEHEGQLILGWNYNTDLFELSTIERLSDSYRLLLEGILLDADRAVGELPLLSADQQQQLRLWNATDQMLPGEQGIHELFELQASNSPDAIAVVMEDHCISYGELNRRANQLAHYLRARGLELEQRVGVCLPQGVEQIVAFVAIIKAGGVYIPLDVDYPSERLAFMLTDAQVRLVLSSSTTLAKVVELEAEIIDLDEWQTLLDYPVNNLSTTNSAQSLAYIIYTSGSTGQPKGVCATHQAVIRLVKNCCYIEISGNDRIAQSSTVSFDAATFEIWGALLNGACLVAVSKDTLLNPAQLRLSWLQQKVSVTFLTTALLNQIVQYAADAFNSLRVLLYGGERCDAQMVRQILSVGGPEHLLHVYGPTEVTTFASYFPVTTIAEGDSTVPIGKPIGNTTAYVLDEAFNQVPVGVVGELYLGGIGVARGYLDRRTLTALHFVPDPFNAQPGRRLYRTGDLVRYGADGDLEYVGRIDHQVKLRGFRIELGEIESALEHHAGVESGLVQVVDSDLGQQLVGYITTEQSLEEAKLKQSLQQVLPSYMVPMAIVQLESFPLTANGKVDRERLPSPDWEAYRQSYVGARDEVEHQLVSIFESLLPVDRVGIDDNFFELGGHSLLATQLISKVRQQLDVELPLRVLFEQPTVAGLSAQLGLHRDGVVLSAIERVDRDADLALSYAQQRLWFIDQLEGGSSQYNMPVAYRLKGELNTAAFMAALDTIVERHEVLRTHFEVREDQTYQVIAEGVGADVEQLDLSDLDDSDQLHQVQQLAALQAQQDFDLSSDVMLRVQLIKLSEVDHVVLSTMHHVASDGWSMGIFFRELSHLYRAYSDDQEPVLPELPVQYADYARWQRDWLSGEVLSKQLGYWEQQLSGVAPVHNLPLDHSRPNTQSFVGQVHRVLVDADLSQRLRDYCQSHEVTMFMFLETVFALLVSRYSGEDDIVIGTPIAGRDHGDTEGLIGFFVNTLVLRTGIQAGQGFGDLLKANKQTILDAYTHQHIPFEMLVEELKPERSLSHGPIFQLSFTLHKEGQGVLELAGLELGAVESSHRIIKFDLELNVAEHEGQLILGWNYNTDLFELSTIERLSDSYRLLLEGILLDADRAVGELPLLSADQQQQLRLWNATDQMLPGEQGIHELFELQASNSPDAIAVVMEDHCISYGELNRRANQLAGYLLSQGVSSEERIGVCMDRGAELIIALLGILKAGAAYVPLDPEYPRQRLTYMIKDAGIQLLLTAGQIKVDDLGVEVLSIETFGSVLSASSSQSPSIIIDSSNLAYVIYTSGSTGQPKGVMNTHQGLLNLSSWHIQAHGLTTASGGSLLASIGFDASTWEIWPYLASGARLWAVSNEQRMDLDKLLMGLKEHQISHCFMPTPLAERLTALQWPDDFPLEVLLVGGDKLNAYCLPLSAKTSLVNHYGPTETAVVGTYKEVLATEAGIPPIGRPIANMRVHILDAELGQVPLGVVGELCLSGLSLARGYRNGAGLTAAAFVPNPYGEAGERLYRTGDLARYRVDGDIEYVGRIDHQVKLRGFRIELGEIESCLEHQAGVESALVQVVDSDLGQQLVGYITAEQSLEESHLKAALQAVLPSYMVPMAIVQLESFPLTTNGKVDRKALPDPDWDTYRQTYMAPQTETEQQLVNAFEGLLQLDKIGIDDNFFELGGHSLLAIKLVTVLHEQHGFNIQVRHVFETPQIKQLAQRIEEGDFSEINSANTLVALYKTEPKLETIYCIPGIGGLSISFIDLAVAATGLFNIKAFEHHGITGAEQPHANIQEIVECFVAELLAQQPQGPYYLAGHSFGGCVAFEMVSVLNGMGHEATLILLDSILLKDMQPEQTGNLNKNKLADEHQLTERIRQQYQKLHNSQQSSARLGNESSKDKGSVSDKYIDDISQKIGRVYALQTVMVDEYKPANKINGDIFLLQAASTRKRLLGDSYFEALKALTTANVNQKVIAGDHFSMLAGESADMLAVELKNILKVNQ